MMINYFTKTKAKKRLLVWKTVSLFVLLSFMGMQSARAQYTAIPDANFEQALFDQGIDTVNGDHQVLTSAISGVTSLNVVSKNISDLTGIEGFSSLTELLCCNNLLTSLNLSGFSNLSTLYCNENKLTVLNLSGCSSLQTLNCRFNYLPALSFNSTPNLSYLVCGGNQFTSLNVTSLSNLTFLNCNNYNANEGSWNPALDIINNDTYLQTNYIYKNNTLTSLYVNGLTHLGTLWCGNGTITSLNLSGLTSLFDLRCQNNISILNLSGLTNLSYIDLMGNPLTSLNISGLNNLDTAYLAFTNLTSLNASGLTNLKILSVQTCANLTSLNVTGCSALVQLNCTGAKLSTLSLTSCSSLQTLQCEDNKLTSLNLSGLTALKSLDCGNYYDVPESRNQITSIDFTGTKSLISISCYKNLITNLNLSGLTKLENLNCYNNKITTLNLSGLTSLTSLDCADNQLTSLNLVGLNNLNSFDSQTNPLLTCILVSNVNTANANSTWTKDDTSSFSTTCGGVSAATKIQTSQCGASVTTLTTPIYADAFPGATAYKFEVTDGTNVRTYESTTRSFNFSQLTGTNTFGTTYSIGVAVKVNNVWGSNGSLCNVTLTMPTTSLVASRCGSTLTSLYAPLYANGVAIATGYRFQVSTGGTVVGTYEASTNLFNLMQIAGINYATTYDVKVAIQYNSAWQSYGTSCTVTTPAMGTTQLLASLCGTTLSSLFSPLSANTITGATGYSFEVSTGGSIVGTYAASSNVFNLMQLSGITSATTYSIKVAPVYNGTTQAYGTSCTVTSPAAITVTQLIASTCGKTLTSLYTPLYANAIVGATGYSFQVSTGGSIVGTYAASSNVFNLMQLSGITYATAYSVKVAPVISGTTQAYGTACTVTTPAIVTTQLVASRCGATVTSLYAPLYANGILGASGYRFEVSTGGSILGFYDAATNVFNLKQVAGTAKNTAYSIRVAVLFNGTYQSFGSSCTVTTASNANTRMTDGDLDATVFTVKAYPNPFATSFNLAIESSSDDQVEVKVYDMIGRELEARTATVSEWSTQELGNAYPQGVYNVVVTQGDQVKSIRMIKR